MQNKCPKCGGTGVYWTDENGCVISCPVGGSIKQICDCSWSDVGGKHSTISEDEMLTENISDAMDSQQLFDNIVKLLDDLATATSKRSKH